MMKSIGSKSTRVGLLIWRVFKRIAILTIGILVTYIIAWHIFPALNKRIPFLLAIFSTYAITAYGIIPTIIRFARLWHQPDSIPLTTTTPDGFACDPINIAFIGTAHQVNTVFDKIGWHRADPKTIKNILKIGKSLLLGQPYHNAPFSKLYLFGRVQDIGIQKQAGGSHFHRHHLRLWACSNKSEHPHSHFWRTTIAPKNNKRRLWVGAAVKDTGIGIIRYHGQITHSIDEDLDAERDYVIDQIKKAGLAKEIYTVRAGEPTIRSNRTMGCQMISGGEIVVCVL